MSEFLFLSTLSLRRATLFALLRDLLHHNFYPRSPCGERLMDTLILANAVLFLSTLSLRRATTFTLPLVLILPFLSTLSLRRATFLHFIPSNGTFHFYPRSPCGERHCFRIPYWFKVTISIHALLAESDLLSIQSNRNSGISIHALLAESDIVILRKRNTPSQFLSTLSLRRATGEHTNNGANADLHFYPRSPCGERHVDR